MFLFCGYRDVFAALVNWSHQPAGNFSYPYLCLSGLKKSWEFTVILMHSPKRILSRLSKHPLSKWELEDKKHPPKIFWLLFPDNDLCLPYPWMIGLSSRVLSVFIIGVIPSQNSGGSCGTDCPAEGRWEHQEAETLGCFSFCEHCLTYLDWEVVLQTITSGKQAESVVIICFGELEHAWITHYHPAACPILTVLCRSIAVLRAVTIKTGNSGGAKPAELFAVLLLALQILCL